LQKEYAKENNINAKEKKIGKCLWPWRNTNPDVIELTATAVGTLVKYLMEWVWDRPTVKLCVAC
jgi:hypothetical protein